MKEWCLYVYYEFICNKNKTENLTKICSLYFLPHTDKKYRYFVKLFTCFMKLKRQLKVRGFPICEFYQYYISLWKLIFFAESRTIPFPYMKVIVEKFNVSWRYVLLKKFGDAAAKLSHFLMKTLWHIQMGNGFKFLRPLGSLQSLTKGLINIHTRWNKSPFDHLYRCFPKSRFVSMQTSFGSLFFQLLNIFNKFVILTPDYLPGDVEQYLKPFKKYYWNSLLWIWIIYSSEKSEIHCFIKNIILQAALVIRGIFQERNPRE